MTLATSPTTAMGDRYILNQRIKMQLLTLRSGANQFIGIGPLTRGNGQCRGSNVEPVEEIEQTAREPWSCALPTFALNSWFLGG
jgi:hypothetical protein